MFKELPVSKRSIGKRGLVYGVGVNDADYIVEPLVAGKTLICPHYTVWRTMLKRCYDKGYIARNSSYAECSVYADWLIFSNFKAWMAAQDWGGKVLDKDILKSGNRCYSPENCCFVPAQINNLILGNNIHRGEFPQGVYRNKRLKKFTASIRIDSKLKHLGCFETSEEASFAYCEAKSCRIADIATEQQDSRVRWGLYRHAVGYL